MVRQWQELMHDRRYSSVNMTAPDFVKLAEAYRMKGLRATTIQEAREAIRSARAHNGPVLIEFVVEQETNVFPMIQPGKALNDMTRREISLEKKYMPASMGGGMDELK